jgi:ankyrin repeat protein
MPDIIQETKNGNFASVESLLKSGANPNEGNSTTALHIASKHGYTDIVKLLLEYRADVNRRDESGRTALHIAAENGHKEIFELLRRESPELINVIPDSAWTMIEYAAYYGWVDVVDFMIKQDMDDSFIGAALCRASSQGQIDIIKLLIEHDPTLVNREFYRNGITPLHSAVDNNHKEAAILLIEKGFSINRIKNPTVLERACYKGHCDLVKLLLDKGAEGDTNKLLGRTFIFDNSYPDSRLDTAKALIEHRVLREGVIEKPAKIEEYKDYPFSNFVKAVSNYFDEFVKKFNELPQELEKPLATHLSDRLKKDDSYSLSRTAFRFWKPLYLIQTPKRATEDSSNNNNKSMRLS